jgi:hypothetical protein
MKCLKLLSSFLILSTSLAFAQLDPSSPVPEADQTRNRVWSVSEALKEKPRPFPKKVKYCDGGRFKPCVCWKNVSRFMKYRPALRECNGNAAIILSGKYLASFSAVVRDTNNRDRWPTSGFNGCSYELASSESPPAYCSAFKTQETLVASSPQGNDHRVLCLGASGYSKLFSKVSRVTLKLADVPNSTEDPIVRWCLRGPALPLN